ncbi:hypothetical protein [Amycolatopsis sp. DSM 110486]|uniref:hypothetical protein n=1 Tax=Amycolatopsis sp. DSM 110486 TaxID=2865832 RepID=UPI001C69C472|nr:hypothetical protein [Amycolatopsis sp. DSM 110486]QYN17551.1 hypothetical protein K1T34_32720 [Amycolatopsis sp. DSM 110486]
MNWRRIFFVFAPIAIALIYVIDNPAGASHLVTNIIDFLRDGAEAIAAFIGNVINQNL